MPDAQRRAKHITAMRAAVGFTGSLKAGRVLFDMAAAREKPIPVFAEMGSVNPLVVLPGAIAERGEKIAEQLAGSVLLGGGQFCTKPGIIFTVGDDAKFVSALAANISKAASPTMLNAGLREKIPGSLPRVGPGVRTQGWRVRAIRLW